MLPLEVDAVPVVSDKKPLAPFSPAPADAKITVPLLPSSLKPDIKEIDPPVPAFAEPERTVILPPGFFEPF